MGTSVPGDGNLIREIEDFLAGKKVAPAAPGPRLIRRRFHPVRSVRRRLRRLWARKGVRIIVVGLIVLAVVVSSQRWQKHAVSASDHASTAAAGPGYSFLQVNPNNAPVRWNPCKPIHYKTNLVEAPPYAQADLTEALVKISQASGLRFANAGPTTKIPSTHYGISNGHDGAPVIIAWATADQTDGLGKNSGPGGFELGRGGAAALRDVTTGHEIYVSGSVVIDAQASAVLHPGFGTDSLGLLLMHELGHMVGLGHVNDLSEVMNPEVPPYKAGEWGQGDLAGLARVGASQGCVHMPSRRTIPLY